MASLSPPTRPVRIVRSDGACPWICCAASPCASLALYPVEQLAALYARRWQIELSFRQIKIALAMDHLAVCSPGMIERSIAMHLLVYQFIRGLMQEAAICWHKALEQI